MGNFVLKAGNLEKIRPRFNTKLYLHFFIVFLSYTYLMFVYAGITKID